MLLTINEFITLIKHTKMTYIRQFQSKCKTNNLKKFTHEVKAHLSLSTRLLETKFHSTNANE